jgi:hypothetical protein
MSAPKHTERPTREDAKAVAARVLDSAIRAAGLTNAQVAEAFDVTQTRVRDQRSDDPSHLSVVANLADLLLAPPSLYEAVKARIEAERARLYGAERAASAEAQALRALAFDGAVLQQVATALSDGVLSPEEVPEIEALLDRSTAAREQLAGALRRVARREGA